MNIMSIIAVKGATVAAELASNPEAIQKMRATYAMTRIPRAVAAVAADMGSIGDRFVSVIVWAARIIGIGLMAWGGISFGLSFSAHDASQKKNGITEFLSGLVIFFLPYLINYLTNTNTVDTAYSDPFAQAGG